MAIKKYVIHCDACGKNIVTEATDKLKALVSIKTALIPGGNPYLENGKTKQKKPFQRPPMFKCPSCGRGVVARNCMVVESKHIERVKDEEKNLDDGRQDSSAG